ncbi:hypothetical protein OR221_0033 [Microbacterium laevaniformans OR221]|jgi:hypothetical protein|nr:hypothetical protein OR221_0033 [Microbacterium laevaniformans OR221]
MGYLLSLQGLNPRDGEQRDVVFASATSASICYSTTSASIC